MLICGLDLETTGLDTEKDEIIEVALVLWDTDLKKPVEIHSQLVRPDIGVIPPDIEAITGISMPEIDAHAESAEHAAWQVEDFTGRAAAVVAHNGLMFDKPFLESQCRRWGFRQPTPKPWIDTAVDVPYPEKMKTRKLTHLAAEHGFINPFAHRALFDVLTMLKILSLYDFQSVLALSQEPSIVLQAIGEKPWLDDGRSNQAIKENGYRWEGKTKQWLKTIKKSQLEKELARANGFKILTL